MGVLTSSNRATITESQTLYSTYVLVPRLELRRDVMQRVLVPDFDARLVLGYISPVPEDRSHRFNVMNAARSAFTIDQWQEAAGFPALPNGAGEGFFVPTANTTHNNLDVPDQSLDPLPPITAPKARAVPAKEAAPRGRTKTPLDDLAARLEPQARAAFLALLATLTDETDLATLEAALTSGRVDAALDTIPWGTLADATVPLLAVLRSALDLAGTAEAAALSQTLGVQVSWTLASAHAVASAQQQAGALITQISETSRAAVRSIIEEGLQSGTATPKLARQIREQIGLTERQTQAVARFRQELTAQGVDDAQVERRVARYSEAQRTLRSKLVAQTEIQMALNRGIQASWDEAVAAGNLRPDDWRKVWHITEDDKLCPACQGIPTDPANQSIPIQGTFTTPGGPLQVPPAHPLCRCSVSIRYVRAS
jgi:hypothetical protein